MRSVWVLRHANQVQYVEPQKDHYFSGHYLRNRSTLGIGVLGYIGIFQHKEHSPEVLSIPPGTPCICHAVRPLVDPFQSHVSRSLFKGLP